MSHENLMTISAAARRLGVSRATILRHIADGEFGTVDVGRGSVRKHLRLCSRELEDFVHRRWERHQPFNLSYRRSSRMHAGSEYDIHAIRKASKIGAKGS